MLQPKGNYLPKYTYALRLFPVTHDDRPRAFAGSPTIRRENAPGCLPKTAVHCTRKEKNKKGGAKNTLRTGRTSRVARPEAVGLEGTKRSEVGYPTATKPWSGWPVPGREFCDLALRRRSRGRDAAVFFDDPGRCGGSSRYSVSFLLMAYAVRQSSCPTRIYPRLRLRFPPSV